MRKLSNWMIVIGCVGLLSGFGWWVGREDVLAEKAKEEQQRRDVEVDSLSQIYKSVTVYDTLNINWVEHGFELEFFRGDGKVETIRDTLVDTITVGHSPPQFGRHIRGGRRYEYSRTVLVVRPQEVEVREICVLTPGEMDARVLHFGRIRRFPRSHCSVSIWNHKTLFGDTLVVQRKRLRRVVSP